MLMVQGPEPNAGARMQGRGGAHLHTSGAAGYKGPNLASPAGVGLDGGWPLL